MSKHSGDSSEFPINYPNIFELFLTKGGELQLPDVVLPEESSCSSSFKGRSYKGHSYSWEIDASKFCSTCKRLKESRAFILGTRTCDVCITRKRQVRSKATALKARDAPVNIQTKRLFNHRTKRCSSCKCLRTHERFEDELRTCRRCLLSRRENRAQKVMTQSAPATSHVKS